MAAAGLALAMLLLVLVIRGPPEEVAVHSEPAPAPKTLRAVAGEPSAAAAVEPPPSEPVPREPLARDAGTPPVVEASPRRPAPRGRLRIFAEPWAEVWVDGKATNKTTPIDNLELTAGRHRLRLVNPVSGASKELWVDVPAGRAKLLQVKLE